MMNHFTRVTYIILLAILLGFCKSNVKAQAPCQSLDEEYVSWSAQIAPETPEQGSKAQLPYEFDRREFAVNYDPSLTQRVMLSSSPDGDAPLRVDDIARIWNVSQPDDVITLDFRSQNGGIISLPAQDITQLLDPGENTLVLSLTDETKGRMSSTPWFVVIFQSCVPTSTPTHTPTQTPTETSTRTPTPTPTATELPTETSTEVPTFTATYTLVAPTNTYTPLPTATASKTPMPTQIPTYTPMPTSTSTPLPTATSTPTATPTPIVAEPTLNWRERLGNLDLLMMGGLGLVALLIGLAVMNQRAQAGRLRGELDISLGGKWVKTVDLDEQKAAELTIGPDEAVDVPVADNNPTWRSHLRRNPVDGAMEIAEMVPGFGSETWRYQPLPVGEPVKVGPYVFMYQTFDEIEEDADA